MPSSCTKESAVAGIYQRDFSHRLQLTSCARCSFRGQLWVPISSPKPSGAGADCTKLPYSRPMRANYPLRIEEARRALVFRSRELLATSPNHDGEVEAIEMHSAVHSLENCMKLDTKGSPARSASLIEFCPNVSDGEVLHDSQVEN